MKTASPEIRLRAIEAYGSGKYTRQQIADFLGYHVSSIKNWIRQYGESQRLHPLPKGHMKATFSQDEEGPLIAYVEANPDATLEEIRNNFQKKCCLQTISATMERLGFRRKKNDKRQRARA